MSVIPCFLCGSKLEMRVDKNEKPYFICDPCGIQMFIRRKKGIEQLEKLITAFRKKQFVFQEHSRSLAEIQGILSEFDGVKNEIEKLENQLGIFFQDSDRVAARDALKKHKE